MRLSTPMILGALLLGGCGSAPMPSTPALEDRGGALDASENLQTDGVRLALLTPSGDSNLAALQGFLHVEGPCLYVTGDGGDGGKTLPAFSIPGVRWDGARNRLIAHGKSFAPGQHVVLGGYKPFDRDALRWVQRPDPSCDTSEIFMAGTIDAAPEEGRP